MICAACGFPITSTKEMDPHSAIPRRGKGKPKYALHAKCEAPFLVSVCAGHTTPPGLDEIERF